MSPPTNIYPYDQQGSLPHKLSDIVCRFRLFTQLTKTHIFTERAICFLSRNTPLLLFLNSLFFSKWQSGKMAQLCLLLSCLQYSVCKQISSKAVESIKTNNFQRHRKRIIVLKKNLFFNSPNG